MNRNFLKKRVGIVGTGFIAKGFAKAIAGHSDFQISNVLTRRQINECIDFPLPELLTNSIWELIDNSDIVMESTGDVYYATEIINEILTAGIPVVTMDAEFHVTTGSYFKSKGLLTEAEGDQPGSLAVLNENIKEMGFSPLVFGNIKGFLNLNPTLENMIFWSQKQGISLNQVTSFTDGTKLQIEQALVANGLEGIIIKNGLVGPESDNIESAAFLLADFAKNNNCTVSDYLLSAKLPRGVFIVAGHPLGFKNELNYYGLGKGPYYIFLQNNHLCHFEIIKTIKRILSSGSILLDNGDAPKISVAAVAKCFIKKGTRIDRAIGSFLVRGIAVRIADYPNHVPIGLISNSVFTQNIEPGELISFDSVELKDGLALKAWTEIKHCHLQLI